MTSEPIVSPRLDAIARLLWKQFGAGGNYDAQRDVWNVIAQDILRVTTTPPDHVVLPRAEVEALRARCERLRLTLTVLILHHGVEATDWEDEVCLHKGDLADNLRSLDDLPPLAGNPLDERTTG